MGTRRIASYVFAAGASLLLLWSIVLWTEWLPRPTPAQQTALAMMRAPPESATGARNAWELIWLLPHAVPPEEQATVLQEDIRALDALADGPATGGYLSVAESRYPRRFQNPGRNSRFCTGESRCLAAVRADPDGAEAEWQEIRPLLDAVRRLDGYDHFRTPHRPSLMAPIPTFGQASPAQLLDNARSFVAGDRDAALARHCADTAAWRALKGRSDSLVFEVVLATHLRRATALYAEMRAELRADHPLPASCGAAFALPRVAERQSCDVYRSEFRMIESAMRPETLAQQRDGDGKPGWLRRTMTDLVINQQAGAARAAERFAALCVAARQPAEGVQEPLRESMRECSGVERVFDPLGCVLSAIASAAYADYWKRDRDWEGSLRLMALADRIAGSDDPAAAFDAASTLRAEFEQEVRFHDGRVAMKLMMARGDQDPWWSLPLPGSVQSAEDAAAE